MKVVDSPDEFFEERIARLDRPELLVEAWRKLKLPPRDYLLDSVLCTTSRWLVIGETGVGKTLFLLDMAFAIAGGRDLAHWKGSGKPRRVMFLDGELPGETIQERIELSAEAYGEPEVWIYSRDVLKPGEMPPLNEPEGHAWLWREIERVKPDVVVFDSIMSLLIGPMTDEETWAPIVPLIRQLSARRIAQVWAHHTGHDTSKGYGSKTREWELDSVAMLSKSDTTEETGTLRLEFTKARLRTPATAALFAPKLITRNDLTGWTADVAPKTTRFNVGTQMKQWALDAIDELSDGMKPEAGHNRTPVRKVDRDQVRDRLVKLGILESDKNGVIGKDRTALSRAIKELIGEKIIAGDDTRLWRIRGGA